MAVCPKCKTDMVASKGRMVCPDISCPFAGYELIKALPKYDELLKENKRIKERGVYIPENKRLSEVAFLLSKLRKEHEEGWLYFVKGKQ